MKTLFKSIGKMLVKFAIGVGCVALGWNVFLRFAFNGIYDIPVLGHLLANLVDKGVKEVYFVNDYGNINIYYDGISKKDIKQITEPIIQNFNKEFFVQINLDNPGEKNFKYTLVEESFAEDRFGNKIGIGDLVLSPQASDNGGSWVDPIIVKSIQKDRIVPDIKKQKLLSGKPLYLTAFHTRCNTEIR